MSQFMTGPANPISTLHPRLRTAFSVLGYCEGISSGRSRRDGTARELIAGEIAARNAALELLRHYMSGEVLIDAPSHELSAPSCSPTTAASGGAEASVGLEPNC